MSPSPRAATDEPARRERTDEAPRQDRTEDAPRQDRGGEAPQQGREGVAQEQDRTGEAPQQDHTGEAARPVTTAQAAQQDATAEAAPRARTVKRGAPQATPAKKATSAKKAAPTKKAAAPARKSTAQAAAIGEDATAATSATKKAAKKAAKTAATSTPPRTAVALVGGSVVGRTKAEDGPATTPRLLDRPGHAAELLALAAVRTIGPQARDWAAEMRANYPAATADGLARLATRRFVRLAGAGGAVSTALGLLTPVAELTAMAWAQAALVLHMAAAYGRDPLDAERAVDLLVLVGMHPSPEVARAALAEATELDVEVEGSPAVRAVEAAWRLAMPLSNQSRGWLAVRMFARRLPGVVTVTAAVGAAAAVERLAYRARAHYRAA